MTIAGIDGQTLRSYVDRVVHLHQDRAEVNALISEVYAEAKEAGIVTGHLRQVVREAMMDAEEREASYAVLESYRRALGMLAGTPLGDAAMAQQEGGAVATLRRGPGRPRKDAIAPVLVTEANGIGDPMGAA